MMNIKGIPEKFLSIGWSSAKWPVLIYGGLALFAIGRFLTVDLMPIAFNDTVNYLNHSRNFSELGVVYFGFKQFGYPLYLKLVYLLSTVSPFDFFFTAVLIQRLLLFSAALYCIALFGIYSFPMVFFLSLPALVAYSNMMIPEGFTTALSAVFACTMIHAIRGIDGKKGENRSIILPFSVGCLAFIFLVFAKFQFAIFALFLTVVVWVVLQEKGKKSWPIITIYGVTGIVSVAFALVLASENKREMGEFRPVSNLSRHYYWGVYNLVFKTSNKNNKNKPELKEYYDGGDPYLFLHGLEGREKNYLKRSEMMQRRIQALWTASGYSTGGERLKSTLWALVGGRKDDLQSATHGLLRNDSAANYKRNTLNFFTRKHGTMPFLKRFNDGEIPQYFKGLGRPLSTFNKSYATIQKYYSVAIAVLLVAGMLKKRHRFFALSAFLCILGIAFAAGTLLLDVWRMLLGGWVVTGIVATMVLESLAIQLRQKLEEKGAAA